MSYTRVGAIWQGTFTHVQGGTKIVAVHIKKGIAHCGASRGGGATGKVQPLLRHSGNPHTLCNRFLQSINAKMRLIIIPGRHRGKHPPPEG
jgi:hypothetical protein